MRHDDKNQNLPEPVAPPSHTQARSAWLKRAKPNRSLGVLRMLVLMLSFLAQLTNACYRYGFYSWSCVHYNQHYWHGT